MHTLRNLTNVSSRSHFLAQKVRTLNIKLGAQRAKQKSTCDLARYSGISCREGNSSDCNKYRDLRLPERPC
jgi:hypothetical protein